MILLRVQSDARYVSCCFVETESVYDILRKYRYYQDLWPEFRKYSFIRHDSTLGHLNAQILRAESIDENN